MIKCLITGGAGSIGSRLAYKLAKAGEEVVIVDNFSSGTSGNLLFGDMDLIDKVVRADIRDPNTIEKLFIANHFDYVYNLAGIASLAECQARPQDAVTVNIGGFVNILELSRKYGVKTVIHASSNAIYENVEEFPTSENFDKLPTLIYPNTKYCAERFAEGFCTAYGMNVVCMRFSNVYGPISDYSKKELPIIPYIIRELHYDKAPMLYFDRNQGRDYIHIDDLIDLAIKVRKCKGFDVVNCSSGEIHSVQDLYNIIQQIMNKDVPAQIADASYYWNNFTSLYKGAYPLQSGTLSSEINKKTQCSNIHAQSQYGWLPRIDIKDGLKMLIQDETKALVSAQQ